MGSALIAAAGAGSRERVEELLAGGAELDAQDHNGMTALMMALFKGHAAIARLLIDRGADLTVVDTGGRNAFDWAGALPAVQAQIAERGGATAFQERIETPYDRGWFSPGLRRALGQLRSSRRLRVVPAAGVLAAIRPDMPDDLKALLHTWAHLPSTMFQRAGAWLMESRLSGTPWWRSAPPDPNASCILGDAAGEPYLVAAWSDPAGPTELWRVWKHDPPTRLGGLEILALPETPEEEVAPAKPASRRDRALVLEPATPEALPREDLSPEVAYWAADNSSLVSGGGVVARNRFKMGSLVEVEVGPARIAPGATLSPLPLPERYLRTPGITAIHPGGALALLVCKDLFVVDLRSLQWIERVFAVGDRFNAALWVGEEHVAAATDLSVVLFRRVEGDLVEVGRVIVDFEPSGEHPTRGATLLAARPDGRALVTWGRRKDRRTEIVALAVEGDALVEIGRLTLDGEGWVERRGGALGVVPRGRSSDWWRIVGLDRALDHLDQVAPRPPEPGPGELVFARLSGTPPYPMSRPSTLAALGGRAFGTGEWSWRGPAGFSFGLRPAPQGQHAALIVAPDRRVTEILDPSGAPLVARRYSYAFHRDGQRLLVLPHGSRTLLELKVKKPRSRVVLEWEGLDAADWGPDGLLIQDRDSLSYQRPGGERWWRAPCDGSVSFLTFGDHRFLLAHRGLERPGVFVYALSPSGPIPIGGAPITHLATWEAGGRVYLLDHFDTIQSRRYEILGWRNLEPVGAPAERIADPRLLEERPLRLLDLRRGSGVSAG